MAEVRLAGAEFAMPGLPDRGPVTLALRPEAAMLGRTEGREVVLSGTITDVHFMGSVIRVRAEVAGQTISLDTFNRADAPPPAVGAAADISLSARDLIVLGA